MNIYLDKSTGYHKLDYTATLLITLEQQKVLANFLFFKEEGVT